MTDEITLPCADGMDPDCEGRVPPENYSQSYFDLTPAQRSEVADEANEHTSSDDFETEIDRIYVKIETATCSACGSDAN